MFKSLRGVGIALAVGVAGVSSNAAATGLVVVGGDVTGTFNLGPTEFGGVEGNRTFFDRIRGDATRVSVFGGTFNNFATGNLESYYRFGLGLQVDRVNGALTHDSLVDVGMLALVMPDRQLTSDETNVLATYIRNSGRVLLLGEASEANFTFPVVGVPEGTKTNNYLNALLAGIGSGIRLDNNSIFGAASQQTTDVHPSALTDGITSFAYGYVSSVSGGQALFGSSQTFLDVGPYVPFFAAETFGTAVPEPTTWAMMIAGFAGAGAAARRRRKAAVAFA